MPPLRSRDYGDYDDDDAMLARDRPYESFGQQGFAMADHTATYETWRRGAERVDLGEPASGSIIGPSDRTSGSGGPKNYRRSDERIRDEICARLADDGWIDATELDVAVEGGEVHIVGSVPDKWQREKACEVAESVLGVVDVVTRVRVDEPEPPEEGRPLTRERRTSSRTPRPR